MKTKKFDWLAIILGVLFVVIGIMSFSSPDTNLISIVILFGILSVVRGLYEFYLAFVMHKYTHTSIVFPVVLGIINLVIGVYLLFNVNIGLEVLPYVFAAWFIVDSINGLLRAGFYKPLSSGYYYFYIIISILGIILGIMLLFRPVIAALSLSYMISFYFVLFGIMYITYGFAGNNVIDE